MDARHVPTSSGVAAAHPSSRAAPARSFRARPRPVPAGATFGVEEEFHLVDPVTFELTPVPTCAAALRRRSVPGCTPRS